MSRTKGALTSSNSGMGGEQPTQRGRKIVRVIACDSPQFFADASGLIGQHSLKQCGLAWEMRVKHPFADAQLRCEALCLTAQFCT